MTPSWFYALLAAVNVARITATRHDASSCCTRQPYAALRSLSKVPAIASYCSSKYPPPTTTKTTTASTVTVTIVTGNTVVTSAVDTRTSTVSEITTLTEPSTTTITSTTTILTTTTVSYVQPPNVKRSRQTPAAAQLRSFTGKAASIVKTACSCIQAPRTTTKTITPSTTIRAISTSISAVTAVVTITATRTETFTAAVSETAVRETVAQVTVTAMPCPGGAPFARTEFASQRFFGICTSAAFPAFDRQGLENASGGTNTCLDVCDLYAVGSGPNRCLGVQYRPTEAASPSLTCTYQLQSATVLTANPTMEAAIAIGRIG